MNIQEKIRCKKGLMSFEAVFSLAILIFFISSLNVLNTRQIDTTIYEYQLLNDILEVTEKEGGIERLSNGDLTVINEMQNLAETQGYCLDIKLQQNSRTISNFEDVFQIINLDINIEATYHSSCDESLNKVSTIRTIPTYLGEIIILEAEMWKQ